jgi:hypothetical protein
VALRDGEWPQNRIRLLDGHRNYSWDNLREKSPLDYDQEDAEDWAREIIRRLAELGKIADRYNAQAFRKVLRKKRKSKTAEKAQAALALAVRIEGDLKKGESKEVDGFANSKLLELKANST